MNYENMSDFEVNKAVSKRLRVSVDDGPYLTYQEANKPRVPVSQGTFPNRWVDYCNEPSDAWPIMIENKISIMNDGDTWDASIDFDGDLSKHGTDEVLSKHFEAKNPLRAAMIVFLMMSEKNDK